MSSNPFALTNIQRQQEQQEQPANPFSLRAIQQDRGIELRNTLTDAVKYNPDQVAEAEQLAKRYPAPVDVLYRNLADVKLQAAVDAADERLRTSPRLAQAMREKPELARLAHDDVSVLTEVASAIGKIGSAGLSGLQRASSGVLGLAQAPFEIAGDALQASGAVGTILPGNPLRATAQGLSAWRQKIRGMSEGNMPRADGNIAQGFYSGVASLSANLAALPMAIVSPQAALTAMVAPVGGDAYGQARDQGVAPLLAAQFGMSQAAIEYATEKIPVSRLIGDVRAGMPLLQTFARQVALEVPGEQVATVLQDLNEWAVLPENADKPFSEYLRERPDAAVQTLVATIVGTGGNVAVVKGIDQVMRRLEGQDKAMLEGEALAEALKVAGQSKLLERSPEQFREVLNQLGGDAEVRFDARLLLEQASPERLVEAMPSLAQQLADAQTAGAEVRVPVGEFISGVVGTPLEQSLRDYARLGENELSLAEAKEAAGKAEQFLQQQAERVIQQAQDQAAMRAAHDEVKAGIQQQLDSVGRFSKQVNEAYATFSAAFYTTMAGRMGMTPQQMAARYPLRIVGQTGAGVVMDQVDTTGGSVSDFADRTLMKYKGLETFDLYETDSGDIELGLVIVSPSDQGGGTGTSVMQDLISYADAKGKRIILSPASKGDPGGTTSRSRLVKFYKRFGFVENKGRNKDFTTMAGMIRQPQRPLAQTAAQVTLDENGLPEISGDGVFIGFTQPTERLEFIPADDGEVMMNQAIMSPDGTYQGYVEATYRNNRPVAIYDIYVDPESRGQGVGERAVKAMLDASGGTLQISNIVPDAQGFWEKVGVPVQNVESGAAYDGTINQQAFADSPAGQKRRRAQGDLGSDAGARAGQAGQGTLEQGQSGFARFVGEATRVDLGDAHEFAAGEPVVVAALHGTTGDFTTFDASMANIESDLGGGFYFTNNPADVGENYAGMGPDLTQKIQLEAERLESDEDLDPDEAKRIARDKWMANEGLTMPVWVKMTNPVVLGGSRETFLTYEESYDEETDEYGEPTGDLVKVIKALREVASDERYGDADIEQVVSDVMERAMDGGISAREFIEVAGLSEGLVYAADYEAEGKLASKEILRRAFEGAGFDGFIDQTVNDKFGSNRDKGQAMAGMDEDTVHFIAFKPTQIKSRLGNSGAFDESDPNILKQGPLGTFNPATLELALNPNANLSTFLHESGHFFLEVMADLASQPNAPAGIVEDMNKILAWFGVQDAATWQSMTLDQKRPYHERFAESIEQYLMEGKAPSVELQPVFQRFRSWLLRVYKSVRDFLAGRGVPAAGGETLGQGGVVQDIYGDQVQIDGRWYHAERVLGRPADSFSIGEVFGPLATTEPTSPALQHDEMVSSDLFRESGANVSHTERDIAKYAKVMRSYGGWGGFPPVYGRVETISAEDVARYKELDAQGAADDLAYSRPLTESDIGRRIVHLENGHRRAYAAARLGIDIPVVDANREEADASRFAQGGQTPGANIQLTDEIRAVFDRMLASEEQIAQAEEVAGMLPDETATQDAIDNLTARSLRDMKWLANARSKAIKALQKQAAALRKEVQAEVTAEVDAMPEFAAKAALDKLKVNPDFTAAAKMWTESRAEFVKQATERMQSELLAANPDVKGLAKGQLLAKNKREIANKVEAQALEWERSNPRPKKSDNASPADLAIVADSFGFPDVDTMLKAIDAVGKRADVIEGLTDQRMLERHGDLIDQRAIEEAANAAVHNDARARILATELKAQAEMLGARTDTGETNAAGRPVTVNTLKRAAELFAANVVDRTQLRHLKRAAWDHTSAERRAAKAWQDATAAGKTQEAVQAKQDQVLNNAAAKAALEAQQEVVKIRDFFARVVKGNNEKTVERGRDPDMVNAARAILTAYGVQSPASKGALEYLEVVKRNDPEAFAAVEEGVAAALANPRPLDTLTIGELRALRDEIDTIWTLAKRSRQMEVDGDLMDIEDAEAELRTRLENVPPVIPGELSAMTPAEQAQRGLQFAVAIGRRVEAWAEALDGKWGGPFTRLVFGPIKTAADKFRTARIDYRKRFQTLVDNLAPAMRPGLIEAPELGYTFGRGHNGMGASELLHAVLHTGNDSNKRKLLLGRGWASENPDGTLDTQRWDAFVKRMTDTGVLTKAHYDFAQGVWDLLEETKTVAQRAHRDVFGRYFDEVTAQPFDTPFGSYRGGYVPAQADTRIVTDAALRSLADMENQNMAFSFPTTAKGFTKSRTEYNRPLALDLRTIPQHIDKVLMFSYLEPAVRDVNRLIRRKGISQPLSRIQPAAYEGMLVPWLNRSARQQVETPIVGDGRVSRVLSTIRQRAGMALMFGNISNTLQQITGLSGAMVKVGPSNLMGALATYLSSPKKTAQQVAESSAYMRDRMQNEIAAMNDAMNDILLNPTVYESAQAWTQKHAYFLQSAFDNVLSPIVWTGAYNQALKDGMTEAEAVKFADSTVRQTQGSTLPEDVSRIETGPAYARVFTQFIGYFNMMANTNGTALLNIAREVGLKKGAGKALTVVTMGLLVPLWVAEAIAIAFRGGPEDEDRDGEYLDDWVASVLGVGTIKGMFAMIPFVGQAANVAINKLNDNPADDRASLSPAVSLLEAGVGSPVSVYKAIAEDGSKQKAVRDVASLVSIATGLPATFVARPVGYLAGVADDRIEPTSELDFARGVVTGTASPESKNR